MGNVMTVPCRSYSAQEFDGCPACGDAALEAVAQAGLYVLGRTAAGFVGGAADTIEMAYRMRVRLYDESGAEMAADELEAEQTIRAVPDSAEESDVRLRRLEPEAWSDPDDEELESTMRLDDFQTVLDRVELAPAGTCCLAGVIAGNLLGFERLIGSFEIRVSTPN